MVYNTKLQSANAELVKLPGATSYEISGEVFEVLAGCGLASIRASSGIYTVDRGTKGIAFEDLHEGQRIRCQVDARFNRVLHADLLTITGVR
jgi:hypothetical protein